jgi:hypothetical protein
VVSTTHPFVLVGNHGTGALRKDLRQLKQNVKENDLLKHICESVLSQASLLVARAFTVLVNQISFYYYGIQFQYTNYMPIFA